MSVIHIFDPWRDPLCTCPQKYTTDPYTGCSHRCLYCYITSYIPRGHTARPKKNYLLRLVRDLSKIKPSIPISMSNSSDPYTPPEDKLLLTRRALRILVSKGFKILIMTKSTLVLRDIDIISRGNVAVSMTITTLNKKLASKIEPNAPPPYERLKTLEILSRNNVPVIVRVDPIIPLINDNIEDLERLIKELGRIGVKHVVASTYKARPDNLKRMCNAFPNYASTWRELYYVKGERVKRRVYYLNRKIRESILKALKVIVEEEGMTYAVCREGLSELTSAPTCDGTHLIPERIRANRNILDYTADT